MKSRRLLIIGLCALLCGRAFPQTQDMDKELSELAEKIATPIKEHGNKKVTVLDFTDLQGGSSELGRYIAEQLTVDLVMSKRDFSVLDRANLKSILAEHKLTATGLVDPENAKKLGQFAGVDAIILGTIISKGQNTALTAKIITTDTAEIVGAARAEFKTDENVRQLVSKPTAEPQSPTSATTDAKPKIIKSFGDLRVELASLRIVNGSQYLLTMTLTNQNKKKSIWVAVRTDSGGDPKATVTDPQSFEFRSNPWGVSGLEHTPYMEYTQQDTGFFRATEIKPGDSVSVSVKFASLTGNKASAGQCSLQLEFLLGYDFSGNFGHCKPHNLVTKIDAE